MKDIIYLSTLDRSRLRLVYEIMYELKIPADSFMKGVAHTE